jgi:molybdenum cofactor cytidylyltransferase
MGGSSDPAGVGAVILAAGSSSRLGTPKQLLTFRGQTLVRRAARAALGASCDPVVVVTGAHAEQIRNELRGLCVREILNTLWETGMASSIRAGLGAVMEADAATAAIVVMLCDQPYVTVDVIAALIAAHRADTAAVVASQYGGSFGVPALFGRSLFAELAQLEGEAGAKQVIKRHAARAHFVSFPDGETDVDTPDDFARLLRLKI